MNHLRRLIASWKRNAKMDRQFERKVKSPAIKAFYNGSADSTELCAEQLTEALNSSLCSGVGIRHQKRSVKSERE